MLSPPPLWRIRVIGFVNILQSRQLHNVYNWDMLYQQYGKMVFKKNSTLSLSSCLKHRILRLLDVAYITNRWVKIRPASLKIYHFCRFFWALYYWCFGYSEDSKPRAWVFWLLTGPLVSSLFFCFTDKKRENIKFYYTRWVV